MLKVPRPGRVKTRLGRDIGHIVATWWFRHQVRHLLNTIEDPRWRTVLAVAPDHEGLRYRAWPGHLERWPQGRGDLGARMIRMMRKARGPVCVIGADVPDINRKRIAAGFAALGSHDAVFGPSPDGGYWLIGVKSGQRLHPSALTGVRWSSQYALGDSRFAIGYTRIAEIETLSDVDTVDDLR